MFYQNIHPDIKSIFLRSTKVEKIVYLILFLLPIFSISVRHWISGWFSVLAILSLAFLSRGLREKLGKEEKLLFLVFGAFLISFFISATLNGWTENSIRRIGTEFKYLLFIPIYLLIRQYPNSLHFFMIGILFSGFVFGIQAYNDTFFTPIQRGQGIYGPITFGDFAVLVGYLSLLHAFFTTHPAWQRLLGMGSFSLALFAAYLTGSRNAWLALALLAVLSPLLHPSAIRTRYLFAVYAILAIAIYFTFFVIDNHISRRASLAIEQTHQYFNQYKSDDYYKQPLTGSANIRLEQWRIAMRAFKDAPFFGYGGGNAGRTENRYIKQGLGHPALYNPKANTNISGIHSTYFETLLTEGIVGLTIVILFYGYPLLVFIRLRKKAPYPSSLGIILVLSYMLFGLTENPLTSDGFSSLYLTALAVIFSTTIRLTYPSEQVYQPPG